MTGITVIEEQFKAALAVQVSIGPIRWPNELWPAGTKTSPDNTPLDAEGNPITFVEAEVIAGADTAGIAPVGQRWSERIGLFRVYIVAPLGSGRVEVNAQADVLCQAFKRQTVYFNQFNGERITSMDPRVDDNVAQHNVQLDVRIDETVPVATKSARWIRMISIPWRYDYYSAFIPFCLFIVSAASG